VMVTARRARLSVSSMSCEVYPAKVEFLLRFFSENNDEV
jgi:hypothetical protein